MLVLMLLQACEMAESPACVTEPMHTCSTIEIAHSCNQMLAFDGLTVEFSGGTAAVYDATVVIDDVETTFHCEDGTSTAGSGTVRGCNEAGFWVSGHGDEVQVSVTPAGGTEVTDNYTPCWDATEPNGDCCGWNFKTTVDLNLGG